MSNIKTMKINDIEVTPVSASTFGTAGNNSYFVDFKKPLTSAYQMFSNCKGLTNLDLTNFDTRKVTDMRYMFSNCTGLTNLDLSNFDTRRVTNMHGMFSYCSGLTSLDLTSFDTSNVTNMYRMFKDCRKLTEVRMGGNPSKVGSVDEMFSGINTSGRFYYNAAYDYSKIIAKLPSTWTAVACTLTNGVLIPN